MKFNYKIAGLFVALLFIFVVGCIGNQDEPNVEADSVDLAIPASLAQVKHVATKGDSFFLKLTASRAWSLGIYPSEAQSWVKVLGDNVTGLHPVSDKSIGIDIAENTGVGRRAMIVAKVGEISDTIRIVQQGRDISDISDSNRDDNGQPAPSPNDSESDNPDTPEPPMPPSTGSDEIPAGEHIIGGDLSLIELPRLAGGDHNYFVTHRLKDGSVNYSFEFDVRKGHSRWVAFTFDSKNSESNVGRGSNKFRWDPKMPMKYEINDHKFKSWYPHRGMDGYDRGHLVASNDRRSTWESEDQTYYYTNMSPQTSRFNQGYWNHLEQKVQDWGRSENFRDVIYVAKGGAIAEGQYERANSNVRMVRPKYYWMALVVKKGSNYKAIGFWLDQDETYKPIPPLSRYAVSIDELESKTGLDLFHNLEDSLEERIESLKPVVKDWPGIR